MCGLVLASCSVLAGKVYRYQDEQGRWHFSDKKPKAKHEELALKQTKSEEEPGLGYVEDAGTRWVYAKNPWWAPVHFEVQQNGQLLTQILVPPRSQEPVLLNNAPVVWQADFQYRYQMGDPQAQFDLKPLRPPIPDVGKFLISQGFKGRFSHTNEPNVFAIDIAMQVGDGIYAARDGTVVQVKDDYHMGGQNDYFLDKANLVRILHQDGSYSVYAHILMGSAEVSLGDKVEAGQQLARCGSSGYSTGPHLHFVVQVNRNGAWESVPFKFQGQGKDFTPQQNQWVSVEQ